MSKGLSSLTCKECDRAFTTPLGLTRHLTQAHQLKTQAYWDKHEGKTTCEICGNQVAFESLSSGYARTCGHSCGCKLFRSNLKADDQKYQQFLTKISDAQAKVWANRIIDECKEIRAKGLKAPIIEQLERISIRDAHYMGIQLSTLDTAFAQVQHVVEQNLREMLEIA